VRRLVLATLLALLVLSPAAAHATPDPDGAFAVERRLPDVAKDPPPRAPGRAGELRLVRVTTPEAGGLRVAVLVEGGIPVAVRRFAQVIERVLSDPRGWLRAGYTFRLVSVSPADVEIVLASPSMTDQLCAPLQTLGRYSCAQGNRAVLNFERWRHGAPAYASIARYRTYMINHEVGHLLGRAHAYCPAAGAPAPLMMQQTKGVAPCRPNPWPLPWE
jgi:hypothetical protein